MYYFFHNPPTENLVLFQTFISQVLKQQGPESANAGRKGQWSEDPWFCQVLLNINSAMKLNCMTSGTSTLCKVGSHRCSGLVDMSVICGYFDLRFKPTLSFPPGSTVTDSTVLGANLGRQFCAVLWNQSRIFLNSMEINTFTFILPEKNLTQTTETKQQTTNKPPQTQQQQRTKQNTKKSHSKPPNNLT